MNISYAPEGAFNADELLFEIEDAWTVTKMGQRALFGNLPAGTRVDIDKRFRLHGVLQRLAERIGRAFIAPKVKAKVEPATRFGRSPFTTGVVHCDYSGPPHLDTGNIPGTLTALAVVRTSDRTLPLRGGYVLLPPATAGRPRRIYEMPHGSLLIFDGGKLEHEVTPTTGGTRWSVILHARIGLTTLNQDKGGRTA